MNKFYRILGVTENSTKEEIKNAHRNLLKKYHPDTYMGDKSFAEKKSAEINEAYAQVIADREVKGYAEPSKPKEEKQVEKSTKVKKTKVNIKEYFKNSNKNVKETKSELSKYSTKTPENAESKIDDLYKTPEEIKSDKIAKRMLDFLILTLSLITIILIILFALL